MRFIHHLIAKASRAIEHCDRIDYGLVATFVLVIGFICMRGYGSRTNW